MTSPVPLWVAAVPAGALVGLSAVLDLGLEGTFARNAAVCFLIGVAARRVVRL